jgi:large subunit ribosomal protein L31
MKEAIHPPYHPVVFKDASTGAIILTRSTMTSEQKIRLDDGNEYPLILLEITADSHPFYTGTQRLIDTQGRVDKFKKRYGRS